MFSSVFPLMPLILLFFNWARITLTRRELKYNRRPTPKISIGIGPFIKMLDILSTLSIMVNLSIVFFTSVTIKDKYVGGIDDMVKVCIGN